MKRPAIIAITGGIGSGKSVVSRMLRSLGYPVYDCDSEARRIQDTDPEMCRRIAEEITPQALNADGTLNRRALAACVFSNPEKLNRLNRIVHGAVAADLAAKIKAEAERNVPLFFVETAILYESGFDRLVDAVWEVTAPESVRVARVMERNGLTEEEVRRRIASQRQPADSDSGHYIIVNDGNTPLIPQILDGIAQRF